MKLNVGCGYQVLDGWTNLDAWHPAPGVTKGDARDLSAYRRQAEVVLLNHVLHLFDLAEARTVLDECCRCLVPGGRLAVVEANVLGVIEQVLHTDGDYARAVERQVMDLVADELQPTLEGKLLEWVTWHGTRRSLWSKESLAWELESRGLAVVVTTITAEPDLLLDTRPWESFTLVGIRP